ncbi:MULTISPECIES: radical SAM protein [unclassified Geobacillus]|uniref:radical SAM protein n=1 Tax=Geobacillus TaxID=129337 RepID=UPI000BE36BD8|nr:MULTISPECIES: radical SAM protein [unclassified Geobacillus]PDM38982.1 radical SAM protein [Parageobacillus yumthangensis]RDV23424.1 radical SAM protein [Parageobacillus toebii]TXK86519.1 radical SAM protein [Geobacillus sp. AYS3]TXK89931.1 radical SAM protein [Parageobacillus sp. SY1]STO36516.1 Anaerobic sulfatase-maturating enzyme [[Flavobacterium] thermophilum]
MQLVLNKPIKLTIQITNTCNLECKHCYGNCTKSPSSQELTKEEWLDFIDELVKNEVIQVFFEGGEVLHRPDFLEILEYCCPKMLTWVRTNGTLITEKIAKEFKRIGVGTVCVDLMGATEDTHDDLVGVKGSYQRAVKGIKYMVKHGVPTLMCLILNRKNANELQQYVDLAAELGVNRVGFLRLYPLGRAKHNWNELSLSLDEMMEAIQSVRVPNNVTIMQSWHPNDGNCCWQMATVNYKGDSIGCPYLREYVNFGNIRKMSFLETWDDPLYKRLRSGNVVDYCQDCNESQGSRGGCRSTAYAFTGRWDAPDPYCVNTNKGVDLRELPEWILQETPKSPYEGC